MFREKKKQSVKMSSSQINQVVGGGKKGPDSTRTCLKSATSGTSWNQHTLANPALLTR